MYLSADTNYSRRTFLREISTPRADLRKAFKLRYAVVLNVPLNALQPVRTISRSEFARVPPQKRLAPLHFCCAYPHFLCAISMYPRALHRFAKTLVAVR